MNKPASDTADNQTALDKWAKVERKRLQSCGIDFAFQVGQQEMPHRAGELVAPSLAGKSCLAEFTGSADPNTPIRMHLALKVLRKWGMGQNYNAHAVVAIRDWLDRGMSGPIPWPGGAFFDEWAAEEGLANVDGFVGLRFTMELANVAR